MTTSFTSKSGKKISLRPPQSSDTRILQAYINKLVAEDAPILVNQKQSFAQEKKYVLENIKAIKEKKLIQLLAFYQQTLIGNSEVKLDEYRASHVGTFGISIKKEYRGEGIGGQLAQLVIARAKKSFNVSLVILDTYATNKPAINLYKKLGFKEYGLLPKAVQYKQRLVDVVYMYRWIGKS